MVGQFKEMATKSVTADIPELKTLNTDSGDGDNGDSWAGNSSTIASVGVGGTANGGLQTPDDIDWVAVNLVAGQSYTVSLGGRGATPVSDTYLRIWAPGSANPATGTLVAQDDDGGPGLYSRATFTASTTGTYYLDARSYNGLYSGDYELSVDANGSPASPYTMAQIADYLTDGYWQDTGRSARSFNVGADNAISVNITALSAQYQAITLQALETWTDITGVQFTQTAGAAEITFTSNGSLTASNSSTTSGTTLLSSSVNVSADWITSQGSQYTLQTFIHEIGHAIGLGHGGNYNGAATYGVDNHYSNDSWQATVMSYFSQIENTSINASHNYLLTPMLADILAAQGLYGASTTTRTGDTTYGYNSNAGDTFEFDNWTANFGSSVFALSIVDSAGTDTIDLSGGSFNNVLSLVAGSISDVMGETGNLSIGSGTVIENAIGGSGNDTITGNDAENTLQGGGGTDFLYGGGGNDLLIGGPGADEMHGQAGIDTVSYADENKAVVARLDGRLANWGAATGDVISTVENLIGTNYNDTLVGSSGANTLNGGDGDDKLWGRAGNDTLLGGGGNDLLIGRQGADEMHGEAGIDTVSYAYENKGVVARLDGRLANWGAATGDVISTVENLIGTNYNDTLVGSSGANILNGGDGDDKLWGRAGNDTLLGGGGNDLLIGRQGADTMHGEAGIDTVSYAYEGKGVVARLDGVANSGAAAGDVISSVENLIGTNYNDTLVGSAGANTLDGGGGNDTINGGLGNDLLIGNAGSDTFIFAAGDGNDVIDDHSLAEGDRIDVTDYGYTSTADFNAFYFDGNDTVIDLNGSDQVTVSNVDLTSLANPDDPFDFV